MNTPAVNNPASICSGPASSKPSNAGNSDVAFDQVLSREVADRSDASSAGASEAAPAAPPSQPNAKPAAAKSPDDDKPKDAADTTQADNSAQAQTASAQLLAFVANLGNLKPTAAATEAATLKLDARPIAATGKGQTLLAGVRDTASATDTATDRNLAARNVGDCFITTPLLPKADGSSRIGTSQGRWLRGRDRGARCVRSPR
jgi:hypothetical protein